MKYKRGDPSRGLNFFFPVSICQTTITPSFPPDKYSSKGILSEQGWSIQNYVKGKLKDQEFKQIKVTHILSKSRCILITANQLSMN